MRAVHTVQSVASMIDSEGVKKSCTLRKGPPLVVLRSCFSHTARVVLFMYDGLKAKYSAHTLIQGGLFFRAGFEFF